MNNALSRMEVPVVFRSGSAERLWHWAQDVRLVTSAEEWQRLAAMRLDVLAARIVPWSDEADVELTMQWAAFICLTDDRFDRRDAGAAPPDAEMFFEPVMGVLAGGVPSSDGTGPERAMADLWSRTAPRMPEHWRERFIAHYTDYTRATREEGDSRARERQLSLPEYVALRRRTITLLPMADVVECTSGAAIPHLPNTTHVFGEMWCAAADVVGWANDLASVEDDRRRCHGNLVTALTNERDCSFAAAREEARCMHDARLREFRKLAHRLMTGDSVPMVARESVRAYVITFENLVDASLYWLGMTGRFDIHDSSPSMSERPVPGPCGLAAGADVI